MITTDSNEPMVVKQLSKIREKIKNMNKDINVMKNSIRLSNDKVFAAVLNSASKVASPAQGIRLDRQDLPNFQLKSSNNKYFPWEDAYVKSVNHFLKSFEKVISSGGEERENVWKRYISLTLHFDLDTWLKNELLWCETWSDVGILFNKKSSNNAIIKLQLRRQVFNPAIKTGEATDEYTARFNKADNLTIGDASLKDFPLDWQTQINTLLHCTYIDREHWRAKEIHTAATNIFNTQI